MKKFGGSWRARLNPWLGFKRKWKKEEDASLLEEQFTWTSLQPQWALWPMDYFS
jgi:hypothetical protein